jgi:hypothetical protein
MGLVNRLGDRYVVAASISRSEATKHEVWAADQGGMRCTCREFAERGHFDPSYRCEHMIAVSHFERARPTRTTPPPVELSADRAASAIDQTEATQSSGGNSVPRVQTGSEPLFSGDAAARSIGELVSPRQLGLIRQLARETEVDSDTVCRRLLDCATGDLSKAAASVFIEYLLTLPRDTGESRMRLAS